MKSYPKRKTSFSTFLKIDIQMENYDTMIDTKKFYQPIRDRLAKKSSTDVTAKDCHSSSVNSYLTISIFFICSFRTLEIDRPEFEAVDADMKMIDVTVLLDNFIVVSPTNVFALSFVKASKKTNIPSSSPIG